LAAELANVEAHRQELREQLTLLARLAADPDASPFAVRETENRRLRPVVAAPDTQPLTPREVLRGGRIREVAVPLLLASGRGSRPIHYRRWLELLHEQGYAIAGKDPAATFLTQVGRSPVVRRADRPGMYAIDPAAPSILQRKLGALRSQLLQLNAGSHDDVDALAEARRERERVTSELTQVERDLEEALRVLGGPAPTTAQAG
jgi:hypothetical protein